MLEDDRVQLEIESDYRTKIHEILITIRKIVNQNVSDIGLKERIFEKIRLLSEEIDRERTTVEKFGSILISLSHDIGESAENLEPAVEKLERIKKIFWGSSVKNKELPTPKERKELPDLTSKNDESEDEIPF